MSVGAMRHRFHVDEFSLTAKLGAYNERYFAPPVV
jgi:hypothetical protein